jgi:hypothetical protein
MFLIGNSRKEGLVDSGLPQGATGFKIQAELEVSYPPNLGGFIAA